MLNKNVAYHSPFSFSTDLEESQNSSLAMIGGRSPPVAPLGYATVFMLETLSRSIFVRPSFVIGHEEIIVLVAHQRLVLARAFRKAVPKIAGNDRWIVVKNDEDFANIRDSAQQREDLICKQTR